MRPTRRPISLAIALSCLALLGACSSDGTTSTGGTGATGGTNGTGDRGTVSLELASALQPFGSCDDLLGYLKAEATERVTAYGLPGVGYYGGIAYGVPEGVSAPLAADAAKSATTTAGAVNESAAGAPTDAGGPAYSGTNTVEQGIDEGDTVKTDGTHLFVLDSGSGTLRVVAANDGQPAETASLRFPGYPAQLVRVGTTLLVTGTPDDTIAQTDGGGQNASDGPTREIMPVWSGNRSVVWQVDVADPSSPTLVRQLVVDGTIASIRMTGDVARLVVQSPPDDLGFVSPSNPAGEARALQTNKDVIAESTIDDWLAGYRLLDATGEQLGDGRLAGCDQVSRPKEFHGFTVTSVLSIDVGNGLSEPNTASVVADSQQVYASPQNLYVAIGAWQDPIVLPADVAASGDQPVSSDDPPVATTGDTTTAIHQFRFDGDRATYAATGEVTGSLMNDFSMSEHDGVLRVATTAGAPWMWGNGPDSESFVTTLRAEGDELRQVGRVGELGKGERIYAVRFIGTNGYVVTFRQTDPLYVVDLADPAAPAVTGELKINGYSAYLHPLSDGRLLGVGRDADDSGRTTGAQVSIFDVSDPAAPTRTAVYTLADSSINAEYDYKAFLYWAPEQLVLLPMSSWGQDGSMFSGALGLDIGETITERGRITATPVEQDCGTPYPMPTIAVEEGGDAVEPMPGTIPMPCPTWAPPIERTVVIGGSVYAIASGSIQAAALDTLTAQGQVSFS